MKPSKSGGQRQRYKAAMIPALGLVLVAVLLWPAADEPTPAAAAPRAVAATRTALASPATAVMPAPGDVAWPPVDLQAITAVNPFVRPPAIERLLGKPATPQSPPVAPPTLTASLPAAGAPPPTRAKGAQRPLPEVTPPPPVDEVRLQAIVASGGERAALIDSQVVQRGQRLPNGYRVIDITATGIVLEYVAANGNPHPPITRSLP